MSSKKTNQLASVLTSAMVRRGKTWPILPLPLRRAVIYHRVASSEGSENNLATYSRACREFARVQGFEVVQEFVDVGSGLHLDRTGLNAIREMVARGSVDTIIIYEFHCLTRSAGHALALLDEFAANGARLYSADRQMEITL